MAFKLSIVALITVSLFMAYVVGEIRRERARLAASGLQRLPRDRQMNNSRLRCSVRDGGQEYGRASIAGGGDAATVFEMAKHDIDTATPSIPAFVLFGEDDAGLLSRNAGRLYHTNMATFGER